MVAPASLELELGEEAEGKRIDVAVAEAVAGTGVEISRSSLRRSFEAGLVRSAGKPLRPSKPAWPGLRVEVTLVEAPPLSAEPEDLPLAVLFEDEHVLVVNKAAGMVVHPSLGHPSGTLVNAVLHHLQTDASGLPVMPGNDATRPGIVHRLDRDTSGVLVVAKTAAAQRTLAQQFELHSIERAYVGIVRDLPRFEHQRVHTTHARDPADRRRFAPVRRAKRRARTELTVTHRFVRAAAMVAFTLHTGRTHQIRMHAKHVGHPIFGDDIYGSPPRDPELRGLWRELGRHALHAEVLGFEHPSGETLRFTAPLPPELVALVEALDAPPQG